MKYRNIGILTSIFLVIMGSPLFSKETSEKGNDTILKNTLPEKSGQSNSSTTLHHKNARGVFM
jgi:hypothetical protein